LAATVLGNSPCRPLGNLSARRLEASRLRGRLSLVPAGSVIAASLS
jgi:hypothetical protein